MVAMVAAVQSSYDKRSFTWSHKGRERFQMIVTPVDGQNATPGEMMSFLFLGISKMYQRKGNTVPLDRVADAIEKLIMLCHPQHASKSLNHNAVNSCLESRRVLTQWQIHVWRTNILKLFLILDNFGMSWPFPDCKSMELVPLPSQSDWVPTSFFQPKSSSPLTAQETDSRYLCVFAFL